MCNLGICPCRCRGSIPSAWLPWSLRNRRHSRRRERVYRHCRRDLCRMEPVQGNCRSLAVWLGYAIAAIFIGSGLFSSFGTAAGYFLLAIPYIFAIIFILVFHREPNPRHHLRFLTSESSRRLRSALPSWAQLYK